MLLKKEHIIKAMQLSTGDVKHALERSGYTDKISTADFMGMTCTGAFAYSVSYINIDTHITDTGTVFVYYNNRGVLHADF